jgi:preprotein translocase subunit SecF
MDVYDDLHVAFVQGHGFKPVGFDPFARIVWYLTFIHVYRQKHSVQIDCKGGGKIYVHKEFCKEKAAEIAQNKAEVQELKALVAQNKKQRLPATAATKATRRKTTRQGKQQNVRRACGHMCEQMFVHCVTRVT